MEIKISSLEPDWFHRDRKHWQTLLGLQRVHLSQDKLKTLFSFVWRDAYFTLRVEAELQVGITRYLGPWIAQTCFNGAVKILLITAGQACLVTVLLRSIWRYFLGVNYKCDGLQMMVVSGYLCCFSKNRSNRGELQHVKKILPSLSLRISSPFDTPSWESATWEKKAAVLGRDSGSIVDHFDYDVISQTHCLLFNSLKVKVAYRSISAFPLVVITGNIGDSMLYQLVLDKYSWFQPFNCEFIHKWFCLVLIFLF